jgi:hypothetical protein
MSVIVVIAQHPLTSPRQMLTPRSHWPVSFVHANEVVGVSGVCLFMAGTERT